MDFGKLLLRLTVGGLLTAHGLQKLRGMFGGPGIEGATGMMNALGMHPARANALAASWIETAGGAAVALGAASPAAAGLLISTQAVAIGKVHGKNGVWNSGGGFEYNSVLIAALTAVADGPGRMSIDALAGRARWGAGWAVGALVAGIAGAYLMHEVGRRSAPPAQDAPTSTDDAGEGATAQSADAAI